VLVVAAAPDGRLVMAAAPPPAVPVRPLAVVLVEGELDVFTGGALRDRLHRTATGRARVVVDLRAVTFVDRGGGRVLADACAELAVRKVDAAVVACSALERLVAQLAAGGDALDLPGPPSVIDTDADVIALTWPSAATRLRPVEARVLRLLDGGLSATEVAFRFQRSVRWVEQVAAVARRRMDRSLS
jgi:anti-anti-sigma factor